MWNVIVTCRKLKILYFIKDFKGRQVEFLSEISLLNSKSINAHYYKWIFVLKLSKIWVYEEDFK